MNDLYLKFLLWTLEQQERLRNLPDPDDPTHEHARRLWAEQCEASLKNLYDELGLS